MRKSQWCPMSMQSHKNTISSSGVYANVSANVIALNRCSVTEIRWNKNEVWRLSSLMATRWRPSSWRNSTPLTSMGPSVSNASGMNVYVCWRSTYSSCFLVAAFSAAPLAFVDVRWRYESATVSVTVTFHVRLFPGCHGMRVSPSGRFPSVRDGPGDSRMDGVLALVSAQCMMSLSWWYRMDRPAPVYTSGRAYLLRQPVCHNGTGAVRRGWCRDEDPQQLRLPRCRASIRMLTAGERGANHRCGMPMLPRAELCWSCLWRPTLLLFLLFFFAPASTKPAGKQL